MRMQRDAEAMSIQKRSHADEEKHALGEAIVRIDTELAEKEEKIRVLQEKCDHLNKQSAVLMGRQDQGMKRKDDLEKLMASDRAKIEATAQEIIQIEHMIAQKRSAYTEKNQTSLKKRAEIEALGRTLHQQEQQAAHSRKSYEAAEHVMAKLRARLNAAMCGSESSRKILPKRRNLCMSFKRCFVIRHAALVKWSNSSTAMSKSMVKSNICWKKPKKKGAF